jgi:hypothetical protein
MTKSIISTILLGLIAVPATAADPPTVQKYLALTRVEPLCSAPRAGSEIIVCGRRRADRWRVPFVGYDAGDPRGESVSGERNRIASEPRPPCGTTAFFSTSNCGMVGISVGTSIGPGGGLKRRKLAD